MELLYSWIEDFNNILKKQEINFGGQFLFEFNEKKSILSMKKNSNYVENFFTHTDEPSNISNITAICGKNGYGKTTVFKYLLNIIKTLTNKDMKKTNINRDFKLIFAFIDYDKDSNVNNDTINKKDKGNFTIYIICDDKKRVDFKTEVKNIVMYDAKESIINLDINKVISLSVGDDFEESIKQLKKIGFVYYSPIIDMDYGIPIEQIERNKNYINLSLKSKLDSYLKYNEKFNVMGSWTNMSEELTYKSLDKFFIQNLITIIDFIEDFKDENIYKKLHVPDEIVMYPNHVYDSLFYNKKQVNYTDTEKDVLRYFKLDIIKPTNFEKEIYKIIDNKYLNSSTDVCKLIGEYLLLIIDSFFYELNGKFGNNIMEYINKEIEQTQVNEKDSIISILNNFKSKFIQLMENIKHDINKRKKYNLENYLRYDKEEKIIEDVKMYINKYVNTIDKIEKQFLDLKKLNQNNNLYIEECEVFYTEIKIKDNREERMGKIRKTKYCVLKLNKKTNYILKELLPLFNNIPTSKEINIATFRGISSGETAKLNLLSYLNEAFKKLQQENIILFIDEGESYYHPEWKRNYLNDLIEILNSTMKERKIQIIVTSNSPYLISDLPKTNIIFLKQCEVCNNKEFKQTFGANIHTLLTDSFYLDNTIGEFASQKIKDVIKDLTEKSKQEILNSVGRKEEIEYTIKNIGEPVIKRKLESMYNVTFPKRIKHYKDKLDALEKEKIQLQKNLEVKQKKIDSVMRLLSNETKELTTKVDDKND